MLPLVNLVDLVLLPFAEYLCFQARERDDNNDGRKDELLLTLQVPTIEQIYGIRLMLFFQYNLLVSTMFIYAPRLYLN